MSGWLLCIINRGSRGGTKNAYNLSIRTRGRFQIQQNRYTSRISNRFQNIRHQTLGDIMVVFVCKECRIPCYAFRDRDTEPPGAIAIPNSCLFGDTISRWTRAFIQPRYYHIGLGKGSPSGFPIQKPKNTKITRFSS